MIEDLQILSCGHFDSRIRFRNKKKSDPRTVCEYELELFTENTGVTVLNQERIPIERGKLLLAKPGDVRFSFLHFEADYVHFFINNTRLASAVQNLPASTTPTNIKRVKTNFDELIRLSCSNKEMDKIAATAQLLLLIHIFTEDNTSDIHGANVVNKAKRIIEENYAENITVRDLAAACHISETHLYRLFSAALGSSPNEYLNQTRFEAACRLLTDTNLPIGEIASACGFNSQSYFADFFKRHTSQTPREYREAKRYLL